MPSPEAAGQAPTKFLGRMQSHCQIQLGRREPCGRTRGYVQPFQQLQRALTHYERGVLEE